MVSARPVWSRARPSAMGPQTEHPCKGYGFCWQGSVQGSRFLGSIAGILRTCNEPPLRSRRLPSPRNPRSSDFSFVQDLRGQLRAICPTRRFRKWTFAPLPLSKPRLMLVKQGARSLAPVDQEHEQLAHRESRLVTMCITATWRPWEANTPWPGSEWPFRGHRRGEKHIYSGRGVTAESPLQSATRMDGLAPTNAKRGLSGHSSHRMLFRGVWQ